MSYVYKEISKDFNIGLKDFVVSDSNLQLLYSKDPNVVLLGEVTLTNFIDDKTYDTIVLKLIVDRTLGKFLVALPTQYSNVILRDSKTIEDIAYDIDTIELIEYKHLVKRKNIVSKLLYSVLRQLNKFIFYIFVKATISNEKV